MTDFAEQFETDSAMDLSEIDSDTDSEINEENEDIQNKLDTILESIEMLRVDVKKFDKRTTLLQNEYKKTIFYVSRIGVMFYYLYNIFFYFLD